MSSRELCKTAKAYSKLGQSYATSMELGLSKSRYLGIGLEYADFREYQEGDDIRYIDWRLSARSLDVVTGDYKLYTKVFHVEQMKEVVFATDFTESMLDEEKVAASLYTLSLLLELSHRFTDRITLIIFSHNVNVYRGLRGREAIKVIESTVCREKGVGGSIGIDRVVNILKTIVRKNSALVVVTDYAHEVDEFSQLIKLRKAFAIPIAVYTIVNRWEMEKPVDRARITLVDPERGGLITEDLDEIYKVIKNHLNRVRAVLAVGGVNHVEVQGARDAQIKTLKIVETYLKTRQGQRA
ncbi:MAG: DUF58 domain-containing protein [Ignisphaera sp.]